MPVDAQASVHLGIRLREQELRRAPGSSDTTRLRTASGKRCLRALGARAKFTFSDHASTDGKVAELLQPAAVGSGANAPSATPAALLEARTALALRAAFAGKAP